MSCCISIRAYPEPNDFFDEIIPEEGLRFEDWLFTLHRVRSIGTTQDGREVDVETRWVYAEINCELEYLKFTLNSKRPELYQYLQALAGFRKTRLRDGVKFTMWFEEYVNHGVRGNIEPIKVNIGVGIRNVQQLDKDRNVIFDARTVAQEQVHEQARRSRETAKNEVKEISKYAKFIRDRYYRRAWESYSLALAEHDHAIGYVYDIRDAAKERLGNVKQLLNIGADDWSRFGKLLNDQSVKGGRHNGKHPEPMRSLTKEERTFILKFAEKILRAFGEFLESEEKGKQVKPN